MTTATLRFQDDGGVSEVELSKSTARQLEELIEDFETEIWLFLLECEVSNMAK